MSAVPQAVYHRVEATSPSWRVEAGASICRPQVPGLRAMARLASRILGRIYPAAANGPSRSPMRLDSRSLSNVTGDHRSAIFGRRKRRIASSVIQSDARLSALRDSHGAYFLHQTPVLARAIRGQCDLPGLARILARPDESHLPSPPRARRLDSAGPFMHHSQLPRLAPTSCLAQPTR